MKLLIASALILVSAVCADDTKCDPNVCKVSSNCRCSDGPNPLGANFTEYPQLVSVTFDEAVTAELVDKVWKPLLFTLVNPDNNPIGGTFFVPHEFTDYTRVNELYNNGFEIGVHSITKNHLQSYWRSANETILEEEFLGQKTILNKFGNIPSKDIKGVRTPQLQIAGDISFQAYAKAGLTYDSSWPTLPIYPMFPYTLDYKSIQMCHLGAKCPTSAFKGFWVLPIIDLRGNEKECNTLATCGINGTAEQISDWLLGEVNNIRTRSRAPITLLINSYWFSFTEHSYQGLQLFFTKAAALKDIFFVSQSTVVDFIKNPVKVKDFKTPNPDNNARCQQQLCRYDDDKSMRSCTPCPDVYPWLGNPEGKKK